MKSKEIRMKETFQSLNQIIQYNGERTVSDTLAAGYGIAQKLQSILGDTVHIIHPTLSSIDTPVSAVEEKAIQGSINYVKEINELLKGQELDKPIVMIINTVSVPVVSSTDAETIGGSHWETCVILPKNYKPPHGVAINNANEIIFFIDSLYDNRLMPVEFKFLLTQGLEYTFESDVGSHRSIINAPFPNANFIDCTNALQQIEDKDCGWWAVYNALMFVFTGSQDFLAQFTKRSREIAYVLRHLLPGLEEQEVIPQSVEEENKSEGSELENISPAEFIAIQKAIQESLKK
jgi:hypothetical protein